MSIHPTAIVDPQAKLGTDVTIGAYSIVGPEVEIGDGTWIGPHVVVTGATRIGRNNKIFQFASIGEMPQDKKYAGESTRLEIGDGNVIREGCTINRGTVQDDGVTRLGNNNWIMAYVHVAHDCVVGDETILANNVGLAGHVHVGDYAILGGFTLVHQFCSIGAHAFTALGTVIGKDVPPFLMISGNPAQAHGLNSEGLKRRGFDKDRLALLRKAYKILYRSGLTLEQAKEALGNMPDATDDVKAFAQFLEVQTRGIVR